MKRVVRRSLHELNTNQPHHICNQNGYQFKLSMSIHSSSVLPCSYKQQQISIRRANNMNKITAYYIHYNAKRNESTTPEEIHKDKITQTILSTNNENNESRDIEQTEDDCQQKENDDEFSESQTETKQSVRFEINFENHNIYYALAFALLLLIPSLNQVLTAFIDKFIIGNDAMNERRSFYWNKFKIRGSNNNTEMAEFTDHHKSNARFLSSLVHLQSILGLASTENHQNETGTHSKQMIAKRFLSMIIDAGFCIGMGSILSFRGRLFNRMLTISGLWAVKDVMFQRFGNMQSPGKYVMDLRIVSMNGSDMETWDLVKYNGMMPFYLWICNGAFYATALSLAFLMQIKKKRRMIDFLYSYPIWSANKQTIYHLYYMVLGYGAYKAILQTKGIDGQSWLDHKCNVKVIDYEDDKQIQDLLTESGET